MSTANNVDRVSVPALDAEGIKDAAVVTPDVVEPDTLASAPVVAETATTPALDAAESAPLDSAPVVIAMKQDSTPAADASVVKSAVDTDEAPVVAPVPADGMVKAPTAVEHAEGVKKDVDGKKEVVKEKAKKEKREKKTKKSLLSRLSGIFSFHSEKSGTSSSSSDEEPSTKSKPAARALPTTTLTPATPSKESTPVLATGSPAVVESDATIVPVGEGVAPVVVLSAAEEKTVGEGDKKADDVAAAMGKLEIEDMGKGKEESSKVTEVKETHTTSKDINPVAAAKPLDVPAANVEERKEKPSLSPSGNPSPNPKIHRRISARIGQFMDFGKKKDTKAPADDKTKDGDSFVSGSTDAHAHAVVPAVTAGAEKAVKRESASEAPVLGAPVTIEPMGELIPAKETAEPVKPAAV
ncbi:hypothetical protein QFC20_007095 [Naganishia adeliensis]|uniref:Uncharacterized protein n=1 Tax=Naganishia adeliensis TaxID=92952 RepID=A0ACC2V3U6_9TREE|nr:hypothetical protein QFC20_007095 [Naganishia adeliensis]